MKIPIDVLLICFAAGSVIYAAQLVLSAQLLRNLKAERRNEAVDGVTLSLTTFFWQFGNLLLILTIWSGASESSAAFHVSDFIREGSLICFPLLFSYLAMHQPPSANRNPFGRFGSYLRYALWPWTVLALVVIAGTDLGMQFPSWASPKIAQLITLHLMLLYFVIFTATVAGYKKAAEETKILSIIRAQKAAVIAGVLAVATFVLMLIGYWKTSIPFLAYIELAAMMTSVPFAIAVAYRQYQFPFMDAFIREVISGVLLLVAFIAAVSISKALFWTTACALVAAYMKAPVTRWVERIFIGYPESLEQQEQRIGNSIRALMQFDAFSTRVSEILKAELEAEWVDLDATQRTDAAHRFEIPGTGLWLSFGPRVGARPYMSRHLQIARTAALQLTAHHYQLQQHELRGATARAQMQALQAQINPHFLFNTLNVLASLIHSNPTKAERVTEELADIFRYALESTRVEWVKLDDELHFLESYLEIEKARFEERLAYSFQVDVAMRSLRIPPMLLQPLVENAIKHGISPKIDGGTVTVSAHAESDRVVIVVADNGVGHRAVSRYRGTGIGLRNVRERLQHLYGESGRLMLEDAQSGGTRAVLELPEAIGVPR